MLRNISAALFFVFLLATVASATSVLPLDAGAIFSKADLVVTGEVKKLESVKTPGGMSEVVTDVTIIVRSVIKGTAGPEIVVRVPGGKIGEGEIAGLKVMGAPEFETGDRVLLALENTEGDFYRIRGLNQGRFTLAEADAKDSSLAVQDPFRKIRKNLDTCKDALADCVKDARIKLTIAEIKRLSGAVP